MAGGHKSFCSILTLSNDLLVLALTFQQIRKEERPGPEVAKEVLDKTAEMINKLKESAKATQINYENNKEVS